MVYWPHTQTLRSWLYVLYSDKALPLQEVTFKLVQFLDFRCTSDLFDNKWLNKTKSLVNNLLFVLNFKPASFQRILDQKLTFSWQLYFHSVKTKQFSCPFDSTVLVLKNYQKSNFWTFKMIKMQVCDTQNLLKLISRKIWEAGKFT